MAVENIFLNLSLIIVITVIVSIFVRLLRQPLIIAYILAGIIISPYFLNIQIDGLATFAQIGVSVLLFTVGLNLNPKIAREVGKVAIITGIGQIIFTFVVGFFITTFLGFSYIESAYISIALAFSSTIIIMKLLSDQGDTNSLYGKISIGFLIVQDIIAIFTLMTISSFSEGANLSTLALNKVFLGISLIAGLFLFTVVVIKPLTKVVAKSQELLLLFSVGWAFALSSLFEYIGFSIEIGALLAGISLSVSPYRYEISSKMRPLRDFFLLTFFILLGSQLKFGSPAGFLSPIVILSLFVLLGNPLIIMTLMGILGYTKRNGFLCGLTVSQISEFSFILVALGVTVGHVSPEVLSMVTVVGLVTMAGSTYAVMNGKKLYHLLSRRLSIFERKGEKVDDGKFHQEKEYDIILFGYNRIGYSLEKSFRKMKKKLLVVDNNPEVIQLLVNKGIDCRYGDADDIELLDSLPLKEVRMVLSTIPDIEVNHLLLAKIKRINRHTTFMAVSHQINESLELYKAGADYIITPHFLGGAHIAHLIEKYGLNKISFKEESKRNIQELIQRKKEGHKDVLHERD